MNLVTEVSFNNYFLLRMKYDDNKAHDLKSFIDKFKISFSKEELNSIKTSIDNWNNTNEDKIIL